MRRFRSRSTRTPPRSNTTFLIFSMVSGAGAVGSGGTKIRNFAFRRSGLSVRTVFCLHRTHFSGAGRMRKAMPGRERVSVVMRVDGNTCRIYGEARSRSDIAGRRPDGRRTGRRYGLRKGPRAGPSYLWNRIVKRRSGRIACMGRSLQRGIQMRFHPVGDDRAAAPPQGAQSPPGAGVGRDQHSEPEPRCAASGVSVRRGRWPRLRGRPP